MSKNQAVSSGAGRMTMGWGRGAAASLVLLIVVLAAADGSDVEPGFLESDGVRLYFAESGEGTPVLLIHGYAVDCKSSWEESGIQEARLEKGYRVIAYDNRGHGKSEKPYSADQYGLAMVEDVGRVLNHLRIKRTHVVGYSMGAVIANKFREQYPERLLSVTLAGYGQPPVPDQFTSQLEEEIRNNLERMDLLAGNDAKSLGLISTKWSEWHASDENLRRNQIPTRILSGEQDAFLTDARKLSETMNKVEFKTTPGNHGTAPRQPEFIKELLEFLAANAETGS